MRFGNMILNIYQFSQLSYWRSNYLSGIHIDMHDLYFTWYITFVRKLVCRFGWLHTFTSAKSEYSLEYSLRPNISWCCQRQEMKCFSFNLHATDEERKVVFNGRLIAGFVFSCRSQQLILKHACLSSNYSDL